MSDALITPELLKLPVLSIRQPWAWFILHAGKRHENRDWKPWNPGRKFRGEFLIHAAKGCTPEEYEDAIDFALDFLGGIEIPALDALPRGGIVGKARVVDFIEGDGAADSPWYVGPGALVLDEVQPLPFHPCRGALGFFRIGEEARHG